MYRVSLVIIVIIIAALGAYMFLNRQSSSPPPLTREGARGGVSSESEDGELKHSIPLDEIITGCPGRDCIPSIDNPNFESPADASKWLSDDDIGISLNYKDVERFYPFKILVSHEIVNDTINDERVLVSYCPLCFTAIVFDPDIGGGERVEFGVSGKLHNSNLLMYDRQTGSLWSQITGEAVVGELTGAKLKAIPSDITKFGLWKEAHPQGESLSRDTGRLFGNYDRIPYGGDLTDIEPFFPLANKDDRLPETTYILGIVVNDQPKAYNFESVKAAGEVKDKIGNTNLTVTYVPESDSVQIFQVNSDGSKEQLTPFPSFWFAWAATYPDTGLYE